MNHDLNIKIVGKVRYRFTELTSTNDYALELCRQKEVEDGTVVIAGYQTHGRGQKDNIWESQPDHNLTLSVIFIPTFLESDQQFYLNKMVCLAVRSVVHHFLPCPAFIKWPNDIYAGTKKISGILIQNLLHGRKITASVVGIGLNVLQVQFSKAAGATSMALESGRAPDLEFVEELLYRCLDEYYRKLKQDLYSLDEEYRKHLYLMDQKVQFKITEKETFEGRIKGVDPLGRLVVGDTAGKMHYFDTKEIVYR